LSFEIEIELEFENLEYEYFRRFKTTIQNRRHGAKVNLLEHWLLFVVFSVFL
jgi:hypothetical protein